MVGDRIQDVRRFFGETQEELAKALHLSVHTVRAWEQGKSQISIDSLEAVCRHYNVSADYLLGLTDDDPVMTRRRRESLTPQNKMAVKQFEEFLIYKQSHN